MPLDAPTQALVDAANCDLCNIPSGLIYYTVLAELIHIANGDTVPTDSDTLITESSCLFSCVPAGLLPYVLLQAVRGISGGGGGDTQIFSGNYGGGTPTQTPTTSAALAYDLDSPYAVWHWNGAAWE